MKKEEMKEEILVILIQIGEEERKEQNVEWSTKNERLRYEVSFTDIPNHGSSLHCFPVFRTTGEI